jgi:DtxR family Mn-dependent transcriptional regulator
VTTTTDHAPRLPSVLEDYVKTIYAHTEWQPDPITPSVLATRLGLVPSSVTEMVKKLSALGLVHHRPYGAVTLTDEGRAAAMRIVRRHRLIETWLVEQFGYGWDEVHDEAEVLEHALSDRMLDAIDAQLGHPTRDPHGDPIPTSTGDIVLPAAKLLAELELGATATVVRISDRDPELLRTLEDAGIVVDAALTVVEADPLRIAVAGSERSLPGGAAVAVWLG